MDIFSGLKREEIIDKIDDKYTLQEIIEFLKELEFGNEQEWFDKLNTELNDILGENNEFVNKINILRCTALTIPRPFHLSIHTIIFISQLLCDIGVTSIKEPKYFEEDLKNMYGRTLTTISTASTLIVVENMMKSNYGEWKVPELTKEHLNLRIGNKRGIDIGVWNEFIEYIENETTILEEKND